MATTIQVSIVPRGDGTAALTFNMDRIYQAERRVDEIGIVNEHKAPELMAFFIRAHIDANEFSNALTAEIVRGQKMVDRRRAVVILDEVPRILKERGLVSEGSAKVSGTVAQQDAILNQDEPYQSLVDLVDGLKHYKDLMDRKVDTIEESYLAVRKIMGGDRMQWLQNPRLSAGAQVPAENVQTRSWSHSQVQGPSPYSAPNTLLMPTDPPAQKEAPTSGLRASFGAPRD